MMKYQRRALFSTIFLSIYLLSIAPAWADVALLPIPAFSGSSGSFASDVLGTPVNQVVNVTGPSTPQTNFNTNALVKDQTTSTTAQATTNVKFGLPTDPPGLLSPVISSISFANSTGIGNANSHGSASLAYSIEIIDKNSTIPSAVPVIVTALGLASTQTGPSGSTVGANISFTLVGVGVAGSILIHDYANLIGDPSSLSYGGNAISDGKNAVIDENGLYTFSTYTRYNITLSADTSAFANAAGIGSSSVKSYAYIDPFFQIDPSVDTGSYSILISAGISNLAPVPEPESYAMLLAGLGLIGAALKHRKAKQA
jgi:hypothetical protein